MSSLSGNIRAPQIPHIKKRQFKETFIGGDWQEYGSTTNFEEQFSSINAK